MAKLEKDKWQDILSNIERKVGTGYNLWFGEVDYDISGNDFFIKLPNQFTYDHVIKRYDSIISEIIASQTGNNYNLKYEISENFNSTVDDFTDNNNLIKKYTFDNFVVGKSNEFAHAASVNVAENPGSLYNPLFIYGSSGLGKTHLMYAIGNYMMDENEKLIPMYVSSEQFTNEFVESIRRDTMPEFREKYRSVDLLLVDDIQFLTGKEGTQEEFFHTFNNLYSNGKQIVVTSDKPPKDLKGLEDRIITRLGGGLTTDISSPDIETRIAILRNKNELEGFNVSDEILNYIAENIDSNIRELEGALLRVVAFSNLSKRDVDLDMAKKVLEDVLDSDRKVEITPLKIKKVVADNYKITVEDIDSPKRPKPIAYPRQIAMYLTRKYTNLSLPSIGQEFGGRDHSTISYAIDKIDKDLKTDSELKKEVEKLIREIKS